MSEEPALFATASLSVIVEVTFPGVPNILGQTQPSVVKFHASQFAASFALNTIPTASATIAVGTTQDGTPSDIHEHASKMREHLKVKVYLQTKAKAGTAVNITSEATKILIFRGVTTGSTWQRSTGGAGFVLQMTHWLIALQYGSVLSASLQPGGMANLAWTAIAVSTLLGGDGAPIGSAWVPTLKLSPAWAQDLWTEGLHKLLQKYGSVDPLDKAFSDAGTGGRADVIAAINNLVIGRTLTNTPAALTIQGNVTAELQNGIETSLRTYEMRPWVETTLWGLITGDWAPNYLFAIAPQVEKALVVPFVGPIRGPLDKPYWAKVPADSYVSLSRFSPMLRQLRAVGLYHSGQDRYGTNLNVQTLFSKEGVFSQFPPSKVVKDRTGQVLFKLPPMWMAAAMVGVQSAKGPTAQSGGPIGGNPGSSGPSGNVINLSAGAVNEPRVVASRNALIDTATAYAKQLFAIEVLRGRTAEIVGKLRFDICPGSQVLVETNSSKSLNRLRDDLAVDFFGTVVQVSYTIDAENKQAGTILTLDNLRTTHENDYPESDPRMCAVDGSPLYAHTWHGAKLVDSPNVVVER